MTERAETPRWRRIARRALRVAIWLVVGFYTATISLLIIYRFVPPPLTGVQLQRAVGSLFSRDPYDYRREWVPLRTLLPHVWRAVVAAEDGRFFQHWGFDLVEQQQAQERAARGRARRGASTLTQQLVKNLFFTTHRSYLRKGLEITLTPVAELVLGKRRIIELYMNSVEWGPRGVFGIEAASRHWYRVPASRLTRDQAQRLAAILPAPQRRAPGRMTSYAGTIEVRMRQLGW